MSSVRCVLPARALLGEGPLWDPEDRLLYWVDIKGCLVHRFDPATGRDTQWPTPGPVGSLVRRTAGGLVVALRSGFHFLDLDTGAIQPVARPELDRPENRFNDGKPDRRGRFWAGSMHDPETAPTGALYRFDPDGACHRMLDGLICPNALCWSPDGRTMYHADTVRRTVWAWDFDPDRGEIANRRVFVQLSGDEGAPDGATVDAEGLLPTYSQALEAGGFLVEALREPEPTPNAPPRMERYRRIPNFLMLRALKETARPAGPLRRPTTTGGRAPSRPRRTG